MTTTGPRTAGQRIADTLDLLARPALDAWVATADVVDGAARAHLVPLSLVWTGERLVIAIELRSVTARNLLRDRSARLGVGPTRDVVMVDAVLEDVVAVGDAPAALADTYAAQADWDPRTADGYAYLVLRPERVQAWRESDELAGRTLMRDGRWLA